MSQKSEETENTSTISQPKVDVTSASLIDFQKEQIRARPELGKYFIDPLVDRSCVLLDGACDCPRPVFDHCKHLKNKV